MNAATPLETVEAIQHTLDVLAAALARPDLEAVLQAEDHLREATMALRRIDARRLPPGIETRQALDAAARALTRCRRLGVSLTDVLRVAAAAHGAAQLTDTYGRDGRAGGVPTAHSMAAHF
jgi:hypothetical protein